MNIQPFIRLQKQYEVINKTILINNPKNFDNTYTSLADALEPHLNEQELGDLHEVLVRLEELTEKAILEIQEKSKKFL
jgi:hypothetical protein